MFCRGPWLSAALLAVSVAATAAGDDGRAHLIGAERCGECHKLEFAAWKESGHQERYFTMHRSAEAKAMRKRLGIKRIKRDPGCVRCHYSPAPGIEKLKTIAGVSCEGCHGPARDWVDPHASYGDAQATRETETEEHRRARMEGSLEAGMKPPFEPYRLFSRCFDCHTVADQELVEIGQHPALSSDFELVAWTQGEVRHNYQFSPGDQNREATLERRRVLYVLGHALALEHALRALSEASGEGAYASAMGEQVRVSTAALETIGARVELAAVEALVAAARGTVEARAAATADAVAAATRSFVAGHDGSQLEALDQLLPGSDDYRGQHLP